MGIYKHNIAIGIPTLNRADLLEESLMDISKNLSDINNIYIIDNGNQDIKVPENLKEKTIVEKPGKNLGVAASWNKLMKMAFGGGANYILILNDDVVFGKNRKVIEDAIINSKYNYLITPGTWSSVLISSETPQVFSWFDENFYPAYFEDNDYIRRLTRFPDKFIPVTRDETLSPHIIRTSSTIKKDKNINNRFSSNKEYYVKKWGGLPHKEKYKYAFNQNHIPRLYIVTRTSGRPNFFKLCYNSVHAQNIRNMHHIVIYDDKETAEYVNKYKNIRTIKVDRGFYRKIELPGGRQYNLYLNKALDLVFPEDYIMFIDDDDFFIDNVSLEKIWKDRKGSDFIVWKTRAAGGTVPYPGFFNKRQIRRGQIAMPGFMVNYNALKDIRFTKEGCGDYYFTSKIKTEFKKQKWIDKVIVSTSPVNRQGRGERKDAVSYNEALVASQINYLT